ncbi:MAG: hypothetical protein U0183_12015 [Polyangiaceae bacterium]
MNLRAGAFFASFLLAAALGGCAHEPSHPHATNFALTDGYTYEKNPNVKLSREYWIIVADPKGSRAMLPRPDGDPRVVAECVANGPLASTLRDAQLCSQATAETLPRVNALSPTEAVRVSTFLHEKLRFSADEGDANKGIAPSVQPYPLTDDILDVCKTFPADRSGALRERCDEELKYENASERPSIARVYSVEDARALAARLNELYGISGR